MKVKELFDVIWPIFGQVWCDVIGGPVGIFHDEEWGYLIQTDQNTVLCILNFEQEISITEDGKLIIDIDYNGRVENTTLQFYESGPTINLNQITIKEQIYAKIYKNT